MIRSTLSSYVELSGSPHQCAAASVFGAAAFAVVTLLHIPPPSPAPATGNGGHAAESADGGGGRGPGRSAHPPRQQSSTKPKLLHPRQAGVPRPPPLPASPPTWSLSHPPPPSPAWICTLAGPPRNY